MLVAGNEWFRTGRKPFQSREVAVVVKGSCCICESKEYKVGDHALMRGMGGKAFAVESQSIAYGVYSWYRRWWRGMSRRPRLLVR